MITHRDSGQHFSPCSTVPALRLLETLAGVSDHHLPVTLDLIKDTADRKKTSVRI